MGAQPIIHDYFYLLFAEVREELEERVCGDLMGGQSKIDKR